MLSVALLFSALARSGEPPPLVADKFPPRVPWTTSRVSGSPEPPSPYELQRVFPKRGFDRPVDIAYAPGIKRVFVVEEKRKIFSFSYDPEGEQADVFLDPKDILNLAKVPDCTGVSAFFALTFHPQFEKNRYCFIEYNLRFIKHARNHENGSRVSRFTVTNTDPPRVDPASEVVILTWLSGGHNGCALKFGPDGMLYISTGDAADPDPPDSFNTGQDISDLLSSILRIDVDHVDAGKNYAIPADNPFVKTEGARPEVYAYGLRNPFRMNFDSKTGNLWLGDVGWELWEMIHCVKPGGNYGWSVVEGPNPVHPDGKRGPTEIIKPQAALTHAESCSITGGVVYRGKKLPELYGQYIFGDWQTSRMWAAKCLGEKQDALEPYREIAQTDQRIVSFCEDPECEPLIADHAGGGLYRIVRNPAAGEVSHFPRKLSETGLFKSCHENSPAAGVIPYQVNCPQWMDGAFAARYVATPGTSTVKMGKGVWGDDKPEWPRDSVLMRTLSPHVLYGAPEVVGNVETQLLHFDGRQWHAYTYAWNEAGTDAELVGAGGEDRIVKIRGKPQVWHFASRTQCMTCHNVWCDYTLGFNPGQLDLVHPDRHGNQLTYFRGIGLQLEPRPQKPKKENEPEPPAPEIAKLSSTYDETVSLSERARSYLEVNCSVCHRFGGGGTALIDLRKEKRLSEMKAVDERPMLGDFAIDSGKIVCPGDPSRSVLMYRMAKLGRGRMPHIGSNMVDAEGVKLLYNWIESLDEPKAKTTRLTHEPDPAEIDKLLGSTHGALTLIGALESAALTQPAKQAVIAKGIASKNEFVRDLFRRFDPKEQSTIHLGENPDRAKLVAMPGDAARGKKVFFESGGNGLCARCHRVDKTGVAFGPEMTHMAAKYNRAQFLENILEPSKTIAEGFAGYVLRTKGGEVFSGLLVSKTETEVVLKDFEKEHRVKTADVKKLAPMTVSTMPEGLLADLGPQDAADLLEYLTTLK